MSSHEHHSCQHPSAQPSLCQSLQEMEFERGIWSAALEDDACRIEKLLRQGGSTSVDARDAAGYTALHYAARAGHLKTCKLLLQWKADVNARTRAVQATPLHRAAANGKADICHLLIQSGSDVTATDADGKNALQRAQDGKHSHVVTLLEELGAKST